MGRLASEEALLEAIERVRSRTQSLAGVHVLVTAGPTQEAFDPIRFVSNASTGSTGIAVAREAAMRGAEVTLLLGPTLLEPPPGVITHRFTTAQELLDLALAQGTRADLVVATAAVADWRPAARSESKLKKTDEDLVVQMVRNPDVIAALAERNDDAFVVGFAAETDDHEAHAREKLERKGLDAIVVNDVRGEKGFGTGENTLTLLWKSGRKELGTASKAELAARLLDAIEELR
jgi:phosphopantothenoylcysteine decarboxylase/phosphopantothenate--cysteine ligase